MIFGFFRKKKPEESSPAEYTEQDTLVRGSDDYLEKRRQLSGLFEMYYFSFFRIIGQMNEAIRECPLDFINAEYFPEKFDCFYKTARGAVEDMRHLERILHDRQEVQRNWMQLLDTLGAELTYPERPSDKNEEGEING